MCKNNEPNIRFKGFSGDWEQRKLNSITDVRDGTHDSPSYVYDGHPFITSKNVKDGYINYDDVQYISDEDFEKINKRSKVDIDDILMGMIGTIGNLALIREEPDFAIKNVALIKHTGETEAFYLYSHLQSDNVYKQLKNVLAGGTQNFISLKNIRDLVIFTPDKQEQIQIGKYFRNLDNLITLHQRKCDSLKQVKKYMLQKMFPKQGEKVPEIRFAGFTGDWEQRKFSEVFDNLQNNTFSRAEMNYDDGTIRNIHYGDVLVKYGEYIDVVKEKIPYINDNNDCDKYSYSLLHDGDIIIADTAEDSTVGKCTEIVASEGVKVLAGLHTIPCRPNQKYAPKYLGYYMNSNAYHNQLLPLMQGIKVTSISKSALQDTDMIMPKSLDEQEKIGSYFSVIDTIITLHQRKSDSLKEIKKFMLQNMFPNK